MSQDNQSVNINAILNKTELEEFKEILQNNDNVDVVELLQSYLGEKPGHRLFHFEVPQMSIRDFFLHEINKVQHMNIEYGGPVFEDKILRELWQGHLENNIKGFIHSCPNPDVLIRNYRVEYDAVVPRYNELERAWEKALSLNVYFETIDGNFVFVSAINAIKTRESFNKHMEHLKSL